MLKDGLMYDFLQYSYKGGKHTPFYLGCSGANDGLQEFRNTYHGWTTKPDEPDRFTRGCFYIERDTDVPVTLKATHFKYDDSLAKALGIGGGGFLKSYGGVDGAVCAYATKDNYRDGSDLVTRLQWQICPKAEDVKELGEEYIKNFLFRAFRNEHSSDRVTIEQIGTGMVLKRERAGEGSKDAILDGVLEPKHFEVALVRKDQCINGRYNIDSCAHNMAEAKGKDHEEDVPTSSLRTKWHQVLNSDDREEEP